MLNDTFYLDGVNAALVGIRLQVPLTFSGAEPIVESFEIPGRNGALLIETGAYRNRKAVADCYALDKDVLKTNAEINRFLLANGGYRRLETSDDDTHYWVARVTNGADINERARMLNPFRIIFDCKPQRFLKSGNTPFTLTEAAEIINYTKFPAKPMLKITSEGEGTLTVGNRSVRVTSSDPVKICVDCETMNAYYYVNDEIVNANTFVYCNEFPVLESGRNAINWTGGITAVEITPRWWEL